MPQHVFHRQSPEIPAARATYECDSVTAACMAVRAGTFASIDGFDEGFRNGLEDIDLCLRIRMRGEAIVYRGDVVIVHHEGASRGRGRQLYASPAKLAAMRHNDERFCGRWAAAVDQDDDHARSLWGAALEEQPPVRDLADTDCVIAGQPSGIGPGAAETRALLAALILAGHAPAAVDGRRTNVIAPEARAIGTPLGLARRRILTPGCPWLLVPTGLHDVMAVDAPHVVRLGRAGTATPLDGAREIWASCPAVATALIDTGVDARRVRVVAPHVPAATLGAGGDGLVVVLPAHDRGRTRALLDLLVEVAPASMLTLVPTVLARGLESAVAERLAGARLTGPLQDECDFGRLAGDAELVVVDDDDPFQRRALIAASRGTPVLAAGADGPAQWLLGSESVLRPGDAARAIGERLSDAAPGPSRRAASPGARARWRSPRRPRPRPPSAGG